MSQIADQFAFIPREAISRFLTYCTECQRKQPRYGSGGGSAGKRPRPASSPGEEGGGPLVVVAGCDDIPSPPAPPATPPATPPGCQVGWGEQGGRGGAEQAGLLDCQAGIDLSLPITFSYMRKQRQDARQVSTTAVHSSKEKNISVQCCGSGATVSSSGLAWPGGLCCVVYPPGESGGQPGLVSTNNINSILFTDAWQWEMQYKQCFT